MLEQDVSENSFNITAIQSHTIIEVTNYSKI